MTNEQNIALVTKYQEAKAAGDTGAVKRIGDAIIAGNEGLVRKLATRYARPQTDEDLKDAMQGARMGILRALEDFDPTRGSFSTHAGSHMRDYVQRWTGRTVAVTRPRSANMPASVARLAAQFRMKHGREPSAADLGIREDQLVEWSSGTHFVELDDSDEERPRLEICYDPKEAEHAIRKMQLEASWASAIEVLSPRNREIAERVLLNGEEATAVGRDYGLTHGLVLQVCKRIENRLKLAINPDAYDPNQDWDRKHAARMRDGEEGIEGAV